MAPAIKRIYSARHFGLHDNNSIMLELFESLVAEVRISSNVFLVDLRHFFRWHFPHDTINSKLPGDQGGCSESSEEFENRMRVVNGEYSELPGCFLEFVDMRSTFVRQLTSSQTGSPPLSIVCNYFAVRYW